MPHAALQVKPALLLLAAGRGTRFGGLKQFEPIGPHGEAMLDYSVFDAMRAGFGRVVFVVAAETLGSFKARMDERYAGRVDMAYACQELQDCPPGFVLPPTRTRPWGTLHAVLAARKLVDGPFAVLNADDFYGRDAFVQLADFFRGFESTTPPPADVHCMVAYRIARTLSGHGGVNRGICDQSAGLLRHVEEHTDIVAQRGGACEGTNSLGERVAISDDALASMNVWGFMPSVFGPMATYFSNFLNAHGDSLQAECYLPAMVDWLIHETDARCRVLRTEAAWCGMTYAQDKGLCVQAIQRHIATGEYPQDLWAGH